MPRVILVLLIVAVTVYAIVDCLRYPKDEIPGGLPKALWIAAILLFTGIGPIAWIIAARVARAESQGGNLQPSFWSNPGPSDIRLARRDSAPEPLGPDDDPEFLARLDQRLRDKQRKEYEARKAAEEAAERQARAARAENHEAEPEAEPEAKSEGEPEPSAAEDPGTEPGQAKDSSADLQPDEE